MSDSDLLRSVPYLTGSASLPWLLFGLLLVYVAALTRRGAQLGQRWGVRYSSRVLAAASVLRVLGWLLALTGAARWALTHVSPFAALWLSVAGFALLAITGTFRDAAGVLLARQRFKLAPADHLRIDASQGQLVRVCWDHLELRGQRGEELVIAGRSLLNASVSVQRRRQGLQLECRVAGELSAEALSRLNDALALNVYRVPDTPLHVHAVDGVVQVRLRVWSAACLPAAEQLVLDRMREASRREQTSTRPSGPPAPSALGN